MGDWFKRIYEDAKGVSPREGLILLFGCAALVIVILYEYMKASHEALIFGHGRSIDWELTRFWFLDFAVAGIVTFALVWVSLWFRRMEKLLDWYEHKLKGTMDDELRQYREKSESTVSAFQTTKTELDAKLEESRKYYTTLFEDIVSQFQAAKGDFQKLQREIERSEAKLQQVAESVTAAGGILGALATPIMQAAFEVDKSLQASIIKSLGRLTEAWRDLIETEFKSRPPVAGQVNYGLVAWKATISTYLEEEALDIKERTVATNIDLYLKLIGSLVDEILKQVDPATTSVELFASANILPVEYFNWRDDPTKSAKGMIGVSRKFMDDYRNRIGEWLSHDPAPKLSRVFLVDDLIGEAQQERRTLERMAIPKMTELRGQGSLKILCDADTKQPKKMRPKEVRELTGEISDWLVTERAESEAYAIADSFAEDKVRARHLEACNLFEVVIETLHSKLEASAASGAAVVSSSAGSLPRPYSRYLSISDSDCTSQLDNLPQIKTREGPLQSPDFLAIRLKTENSSSVIACLAAQLNPDYETMSLSLITQQDQLERVNKFAAFVDRTAHPLVKLIRK